MKSHIYRSILTAILIAAIGLLGCEQGAPNAVDMSPDNGDLSIGSLEKGHNKKGKKDKDEKKSSHAPSFDDTGVFAGYNETDDPDYGIYAYTLPSKKYGVAGTMTVTNDDQALTITYETNDAADLGALYVYLWTDASALPTKNAPKGKAPYKAKKINADSYTLTIPMSVSCGDTYYIATRVKYISDAYDDDDDDDDHRSRGRKHKKDDNKAKGSKWVYVSYTVDCFYDISGSVYDDANNSSDRESGETAFGGVTVDLRDAFGILIDSRTTDANGEYTFEHLPGEAPYSVAVSAPPVGAAPTENAGGYGIPSLTSGRSGVDFGFYTAPTQLTNTISGFVSYIGPCVNPEAAVTVQKNGAFYATAPITFVSDGFGFAGTYEFEELSPGDVYTVSALFTTAAGSETSVSGTLVFTDNLAVQTFGFACGDDPPPPPPPPPFRVKGQEPAK